MDQRAAEWIASCAVVTVPPNAGHGRRWLLGEVTKFPLGYFIAPRSEDARELLARNKNALVLAYVIADRANYTGGFNRSGCELGEALLGDHDEYSMTRGEYRTAISHLVKFGFATTRTTNDGTIAKLTDTRLFDPLFGYNNHQNNQRTTSAQPSSSHQAATNNKENKEIRKERGDLPPLPSQLPKLITEQKRAIRDCDYNDSTTLEALWKKLWELETAQLGAPVTKRNKKSQPQPNKAQPKSIFETMSQEQREAEGKKLREAVK